MKLGTGEGMCLGKVHFSKAKEVFCHMLHVFKKKSIHNKATYLKLIYCGVMSLMIKISTKIQEICDLYILVNIMHYWYIMIIYILHSVYFAGNKKKNRNNFSELLLGWSPKMPTY